GICLAPEPAALLVVTQPLCLHRAIGAEHTTVDTLDEGGRADEAATRSETLLQALVDPRLLRLADLSYVPLCLILQPTFVAATVLGVAVEGLHVREAKDVKDVRLELPLSLLFASERAGLLDVLLRVQRASDLDDLTVAHPEFERLQGQHRVGVVRTLVVPADGTLCVTGAAPLTAHVAD